MVNTLKACQALLEMDKECRTEEMEAAIRKAIREDLSHIEQAVE
jgi:hypothetical protein